jgi:hypothetical protein
MSAPRPLWVISGHWEVSAGCPLNPRKRTLLSASSNVRFRVEADQGDPRVFRPEMAYCIAYGAVFSDLKEQTPLAIADSRKRLTDWKTVSPSEVGKCNGDQSC